MVEHKKFSPKERYSLRIKVLSLIWLLVSLVMINGCGGSNSPTDITDYSKAAKFTVLLFPDYEANSCEVTAVVYKGGLNYNEENVVLLDDALVTVNNIPINGKRGEFQFGSLSDIKSGDSLKVQIEHPELGTIRQTLTVPAPVSNLRFEPDLADWYSRQNKTMKLRWDGGQNTNKAIIYLRTSNTEETLVINKYIQEATIDETLSEKLLAGNAIKLNVSVRTANIWIDAIRANAICIYNNVLSNSGSDYTEIRGIDEGRIRKLLNLNLLLR